MSSLPLGLNRINIQRGLTTSSTAIFVPFTTQELFQGGEALYYGLNALSNNMILADRKKLKNPKGLYCKGRSKDRNLQTVLFVAAQQMDGQRQERNRRGTASGAKQKRPTPQEQFTPAYAVKKCRRKFQNLFEKGSVLPPVFLLFVREVI